MKLYSIKPLKWAATGFGYETMTVFGHIILMEGVSTWRFGWSFSASDNAYSNKEFKTLYSAKMAAEAFYQGKLRKALTPQQEN